MKNARAGPNRRNQPRSRNIAVPASAMPSTIRHHKQTWMRRFRRAATVLNLALVVSIAARSFSMCLEDGTNAARAMACCKAHDNCPDSEMARDCCKHERARDAVTQTSAVKSDAGATVPVPSTVVLPVEVVSPATSVIAQVSAPLAAESPPIFVVQHTFRI